MQQLPDAVIVHPDRNLIGFRDEQSDACDPQFTSAPRSGNLHSNDYECYLYCAQTLNPVTLHFHTGPPDTDQLGHANLELPTGQLVVSELTRGAHGPFALPDGPGRYTITTLRYSHTAPTRLETNSDDEHYYIQLVKTGDLPPDDGRD